MGEWYNLELLCVFFGVLSDYTSVQNIYCNDCIDMVYPQYVLPGVLSDDLSGKNFCHSDYIDVAYHQYVLAGVLSDYLSG